MFHKKITINTGRLFLVTDVHGHYDVLMDALDSVQFDYEKDTLVSAGDLIDRGPRSRDVLDFFTTRGFANVHSVMGNHDQFPTRDLSAHYGMHWYQNGGSWALNFGEIDYAMLAEISEQAKTLPLAITINFRGRKLGVVHAHPGFDDWDSLVATLESGDFNENLVDCLLWNRDVVESKLSYQIDAEPVANVDQVFHGHTVVKEPLQIANRLHFDTGVAYGKYLSLVEVTDEGVKFSKHSVQNA